MKNTTLTLLSVDQKARVRDAVMALEKKTSCEVVTALVDHCRDYSEAEYPGGALLAGAALALTPLVCDFEGDLFLYGAAIVSAFVLGVAAVKLSSPLRRLLVPKATREAAAQEKAETLFIRNHLFRTRDANGLLLAAFRFEHQALVYGDEAINLHMRQSDWEETLAILTKGLKTGNAEAITVAYEEALGHLTDLLAGKFPIRNDDTDELDNDIVIE